VETLLHRRPTQHARTLLILLLPALLLAAAQHHLATKAHAYSGWLEGWQALLISWIRMP
jgi:hypothetical protein